LLLTTYFLLLLLPSSKKGVIHERHQRVRHIKRFKIQTDEFKQTYGPRIARAWIRGEFKSRREPYLVGWIQANSVQLDMNFDVGSIVWSPHKDIHSGIGKIGSGPTLTMENIVKSAQMAACGPLAMTNIAIEPLLPISATRCRFSDGKHR
jgi:hypothetical protein